MTPIILNYRAFKPLDVFLTHSNKPAGLIIRLAQTGKPNHKDDTTPCHGGFLFPVYGQFLCIEMSPQLKLSTPENYTGTHEQIVECWRYMLWEPDRKQEALDRLAYLIRKNQEQVRYDWQGAILSSPVGRKLFSRWFKNNPHRWFCSEMFGDILKNYADPLIPDDLSPLASSLYFQRRGKPVYEKVLGWKVSALS